MNLQEACEILEDLVHKEIKGVFLTTKEFLALNVVLFELSGKYRLPDKYAENIQKFGNIFKDGD